MHTPLTERARLGGAASSGMQLAAAAPASTEAPAGVGSPSRKWLEPVTGLAAGFGLASLIVSLGLGDALAGITGVLAVGLAVLACIRFVVRRSVQGADAVPDAAGGAHASRLLGGARSAKEQFEALQLANDDADLPRLRECLTPAMFDLAQEALRMRGGAVQRTQVFGLEAAVLDAPDASGDHVVSVRFTGRVRGRACDLPEDFDETWHLTKPRIGRSGWVLAGIQQAAQ